MNTILTPADAELDINETEINKEIMKQPLLLRKWTKLKSEAAAHAKAAKYRLKTAEGSLYRDLSKKGGLRVKDIDAMLACDEKVIAAQNVLIEAERLDEEYAGIVRSFVQRHDALRELSMNQRRELV